MILLKSSRKNINCNFTVPFGNSSIGPVQSAKILGITLDSSLTWEDHVSVIVKRYYCVLNGLAGVQRRIPCETKRLLIEALVFPTYDTVYLCGGAVLLPRSEDSKNASTLGPELLPVSATGNMFPRHCENLAGTGLRKW